jgi:hypothetical protein
MLPNFVGIIDLGGVWISFLRLVATVTQHTIADGAHGTDGKKGCKERDAEGSANTAQRRPAPIVGGNGSAQRNGRNISEGKIMTVLVISNN